MGSWPCNAVDTTTFALTDPNPIVPNPMKEDISSQRFKKIKLIGKGSSASVYLIKSKETGKKYALKEINISKTINEDSKREINILKNIDHPNIISFKYAFESKKNENENLYNIITEYVDNGDLYKLLKEKKKKKEYFKEEQLLDWLIQLCLAINYLHEEKEIVHRDIKPSNIYLMKDNTIRLGDFGVAKDISVFHHTNSIKGTPLYFSPEITKKKKNKREKIEEKNKRKYDCKVDIWSLGVTFCHLMTLEFPFYSKNEKELEINILKGMKNEKILNKERNNYNGIILKNYSKDFLDVIDEMMNLEPSKRPTIEDIFKKKVVIERMDSILKKNNFNEETANIEINDIKNKYQENEQKILKLIEETLNKNKEAYKDKDNFLVIEDINKAEDIASDEIKEVNLTIKQNQILELRYKYLRQMSLMNKEKFKRSETINSNFINF